MAGTCYCGNEPSDSIRCGEFADNRKHVTFSRRTLIHGVNYRVNYIRLYIDFCKAGIRFVMNVHLSVLPYT